MKKKLRIIAYMLIGLLVISLASCEKFLDTKPDLRLAVPESLDDLQALMSDYVNLTMESAAGEISSGDYVVTTANLASLSSDFHRRMYYWDGTNLFEEGNSLVDWGRYYSTIYTCNTVMENIEDIERVPSNAKKYDQVLGRAFFWRAKKMFQASLLWCQAYDPAVASTSLGLPIRLDTDFNKVSIRATLEQTYKQILIDGRLAIRLLPEQVSHTIEPGKCAAYMLMARICLYMGEYESSFLYADSALAIKSDLLDYSTINNSPTYPMTLFNKEVIYHTAIAAPPILALTRANIISPLLDTYHSDDLRKVLYFFRNADGTHGFRGRYSGSSGLFMGFATDELYLIRAEAAVRTGRTGIALQDINALLSTRWRKVAQTTTYVPMSDDDPTMVLNLILLERRKSLLFRGLRWYDLKRLNRDGADISLRRTFEGREYVLEPNDPRYALPIPEDVVRLSDMEQNPR